MTRTRKQDRPSDEARRKLLKAVAAAGGVTALGQLPYQKPAVKSFFGTRSAWAQQTGPTTITMDGVIGTSPGTQQDTGSDAYDFDVFNAGTQLDITALALDGNSDIEIFLFPTDAASVIPGDTNLLTGTPFGLDAAGVGGTEMGSVTASSAGIHSVFIEDSRSPGNEVSGTYRIEITGDMPLGSPTQIYDENPDLDLTTHPVR